MGHRFKKVFLIETLMETLMETIMETLIYVWTSYFCLSPASFVQHPAAQYSNSYIPLSAPLQSSLQTVACAGLSIPV